ncbi:MAG: helix-turn-helix domain-containing protein [Spirochaetales bacterium]|nr:helix-turn-helix domain-containing protein [Spirochaetales bacterium]
MEVLTIKEVKEKLKCSDWLVRDMVRTQGLPSIRIGKRVLIDKDDLENWLTEHKKGSLSESNVSDEL